MVDNQQKEVFIINDIEMNINPSEIQVMDDNWVVEDSYLRSKAVFCYRSKYSATKIILNIPFEITYLTEENKESLNNTYNCIKLISELNAYPFCFIKNNRIKSYIAPTSMSVTDYMLFAVDEVAVVQSAAASNMVFLEVVLQYFNHVPLIQDFEFRSDLNLNLDDDYLAEDLSEEQDFSENFNTTKSIVNSLRDSEVWKQYMNPRVKKVLENLTESGLLDYTETNNKSIHPIMGVQLLAPTMSVITEGIENVDDGRYIGKGTKIITVSNVSNYDEGTFENLLATLSTQDFSFDTNTFKQTDKIQTINSENRIKQGVIVSSKEKSNNKENKEILKSFEDVSNDYKNLFEQATNNKSKNNTDRKGSKDVFIDWVGRDIQELAVGVQKIEVRRKNRLVTHQIGSYKHPIVQYMGKYPISANITLASTNFEIYKTDEAPANTFIKQVLNVLDYNRNAIPEAEAYNFIKIKSLATFLFDCESFLPGQSVVSASSASQGLENIVYSFNEGDLTSFIEQSKVEASGKSGIDKTQKQITDIIIKWLLGMPSALVNIVNNSKADDNLTNSHILLVYKSIIELVKEAMNEMSLSIYPQMEAINTAIKYSSDLKPNNNVIRPFYKINSKEIKELNKYNLYTDIGNITVPTKNESVSSISTKKYGALASKEVRDAHTNTANSSLKITTLQLHSALIPFLVYMLQTRSNLQEGGNTSLPSVSFTPSGNFNNLALSIISKINSGIKEGAIVNTKDLDTTETKKILKEVTEKYSKTFFGYNIEDLDYEILSPTPYNRLTDLLVPKIDPFFFIKEKTILNGNEFEQIYTRMYKNENENPNLLKHLNKLPPSTTDSVDITENKLQVTYRRLQEIDYEPLETNYLGHDGISSLGDLLSARMALFTKSKAANAKQMDTKVSAAIEKALKKYGKDKDEGFRSYVYSVLYKESTNGTKMKSDTGAVGLFQFTYIAVKDLIQYKSNKLEYSNGSKIGYLANPSESFVNSVKNASLSDLYLNAQMFIEKYIKEQYSGTLKNGEVDPVYSFIQHNIGRGGLNAVKAVIENGASSIPNEVRNLIKAQSKSFIGSNDVQTVRNYYAHMLKAMSVDNVPDYVSVSTSTTKNTASTLLDNLSKQNKQLLTKEVTIPYAAQNKAIEKANKVYTEASVSKEDKTNYTTIGSKTITGVITKIVDGDTAYILDTKTNKSTKIRFYGIDTPESVKEEDKELYGTVAKKALTDLILGKEVTAQFGGLDKYNRTVSLVKLKDGTNVSLVMLKNGNGFVSEGFTKVGEYHKAEEEAKKNQKGLWSYPDGTVTKPRSTNRVDISGLSDTDLKNIKNNVNPEQFTKSDLEYASRVNANRLNSYQPFKDGAKFEISSLFGPRNTGIKGASRYHKGVDLASPSGTTVVAASGGVVIVSDVQSGYGGVIKIDHGNGFKTVYGHLKQRLVKTGDKVTSQQPIAKSGGAQGDPDRGISSNAHLHYEVRYNNVAINPFGTKELSLYKEGTPASGQMGQMSSRTLSDEVPKLEMTRKGVTEENTVFNEDKLAKAIFKNIYKNTNVGLKTSLPAIKIYMTVGNENDKFWLDTLKGDVLFYEIKGVKTFHMNCNNDTNPIDTAIISIADPSFLNTDGFTGINKMQGVNVNAIGTDYEILFKNDRIQLKNGNKIQVRLGYGNDPNKLDIVFNGSIVDVETANQSLNIICEGFGKELLSELTATNKPVFMNDQNDNISTSSVIGESLIAETIEHFGYNSGFVADKLRNSTDPEDRALSPGRFSMSYNWFFDFSKATYKSRLFMNVFAPEIEKIDDEYSNYKGWITNIASWFTNHAGGYPFAVYRMTPWQCMKQMEYRHPNTICKPMIYEDRMTLFYGIKEQMYFKKDLNKALQISAANQKESEVGFDLSTYYNRRRERLEPVSNIHLVTSNSNLISNGLRLNSQYATKIKVNYYENRSDAESGKPWDLETFEAKADDNLYPFDIRAKELTLSGCLSKYSAFLYGTEELKKEAEKMYQGKILITGNSSMKAGDYVFIDDSDKRIHGLVLVRECYHHFDEKVGFITEIVPGQYVEAANFMYSSLWLNLMCACKIVTSKMKTVVGTNFSSDEFSMVSDWLTLIRQAELELDVINSRNKSKEVIAIYGAVLGLSTYLMNSLAVTTGIGEKNAVLKSGGVRIGSGTIGFTKAFYKIYVKEIDKYLWAKVKNRLINVSKTQSGKVSLWLDRSRYDIKGILSQPKAIIASSKFMEKVNEARLNRKSGLIWKVSKPVLGLSTKATIEAAKVTGRVLYSTVLAVTVANPLSILLEVMFYAVIQYGLSKIEEDQIMRQPLLYFPIIRHGKPYVGGMAGVIRNSWIDSQTTEISKTIKEIQKAAGILVGNNDVTNLSSDRPFYISLLSGLSNEKVNKNKSPSYQNDENGTKINSENNVTTYINKNTKKLDSYLEEEDNAKKLLIQKMNSKIVENNTNGL